MKKNLDEKVENISLSAKQIKSKLEDSLAYDHDKYRNTQILFDTKPTTYYKLPFSDFKISISEELSNQQLLIENLNKYISDTKLIEEKEVEEVVEAAVEEVIEEENNINIVEEIYEFDEIEDEEEFDDEDEEEDDLAQLPFDNKAKKPKLTTIKVVDVLAIIEEIKRKAIEENKGKPIIGRRQINKMLKPYMLKKNNTIDVEGIDESLTSIDIYLNAVNKIENNTNSPIHENSNDSLELNIKEIINDLEKSK